MAQLTYTLKELACPDGQKATIVELNGSVDPSSIDDFDAIFDELLESGNVRIAMDLGKLKYINSTGMGMMVQYYDQLSDEGGGLVLMAVQAKIILVLEMLGLQELFPIVSNEQEAVAALMGQSVTPANVEVKLEESTPPEARGGSGVTCGSCGADLVVGGKGVYMCPRCRAIIEIDKTGRAHTSAPAGGEAVEIAVPAAAAFYKSAAALLARIGIKSGLSDSAAMGAAASIQATLAKMSEICLDEYSRETHRLQMIGAASNDNFEVRIFCGGKSIGDSTLLRGCDTGFDSIRLTPVPGGSIVALSKRVG